MSKKIVLALALTSLSLLAYSDYDMDGVEDKYDNCPNTSFNELVDVRGCTTKTLQSPHHFDVIVGIHYDDINYETNEKTDTFTKTLQVDYYYKNFSLQASSEHYDSDSTLYDKSGTGDSFLGAYYKLKPEEKVSLRLGIGAIFPTYSSGFHDNNTDYMASIGVSYMLASSNIFGGYSHTIVNDDDSNTLKYQNTNAYNFGMGFYPIAKLYVSGAYNSNESIYTDVDAIETLSVNTFYTLDANWFTTFTYAYGLSESASDNALSLRIGYYF